MQDGYRRMLVLQGRAQRVLFWSSYSYAAIVLICAAVLRFAGDSSCIGTLFLFFPRWILGVPLLPLAFISSIFARRLLWIQILASALFLIPWMGFCCSIRNGSTDRNATPRITILTCNIQGNASDERLRQVIVGFSPDVVMLQECPASLVKKLFDDTWNVRHEHQLCIASRFKITDWSVLSRETYGGWGIVASRISVAVAGVDCDFVNVHLSTARSGLEAVRHRGLFGLSDLAASTAQRRVESHGVAAWAFSDRPLVIAGDFNTPVESQIYLRDWGRYTNGFSRTGWGLGRTKFTRWHGIRIDHVLVNSRWRVDTCRIGPDIGSDHRPVIAALYF
jgi:endonuclease/exonuclease/phosphatase family metal-dependent hydrolase